MRDQFSPRETKFPRRRTVQEHGHLHVLRHARAGEVAARDDKQFPRTRRGAVALHVHQALAIHDVHIGTAFEQRGDDLPAGQLLSSVAGEDSHDLAATVYMVAKYRIEPDAPVVVGESRHDVHGAIAGGLFAEPERLQHRQ